MDAIGKFLLSLPIGIIAIGAAKFVHPGWSLIQLLIFGFMVFAVTFILSLLIKKKRLQNNFHGSVTRSFKSILSS